MGFQTKWTDERTARAQELWGLGYSASDIATDLGLVTRNAVIGRLHRAGKPPERCKRSGKPKPKAPKIDKRTRVYVAQLARPKKVKPVMNIPLDTRTERSLSFDQAFHENKLTENCCRWIIGDVGNPDWFYCGEVIEGMGSYCPRHLQAAWVPVPRDASRIRWVWK